MASRLASLVRSSSMQSMQQAPAPGGPMSQLPQRGGPGRGQKVQKVMTQPINVIFKYLQSKARVSVWLFEQTDVRIEGAPTSCPLLLPLPYPLSLLQAQSPSTGPKSENLPQFLNIVWNQGCSCAAEGREGELIYPALGVHALASFSVPSNAP